MASYTEEGRVKRKRHERPLAPNERASFSKKARACPSLPSFSNG